MQVKDLTGTAMPFAKHECGIKHDRDHAGQANRNSSSPGYNRTCTNAYFRLPILIRYDSFACNGRTALLS